MKPIWWVLLISSIVLIPLVGLIILLVWLEISLWHIFWLIGFDVIVGLIALIIYIWIKWKKRPKDKLEIDPKDAEERVINAIKNDIENPDNFVIEMKRTLRVGEPGKERTPIRWLQGRGTEMMQKRDILINLNDEKGDFLDMVEKNEEYIINSAKIYAENPSSEIVEEKLMGLDEFGRPLTTVKTKKILTAEKKQQEEIEKAEEVNKF